MPKETFLNLSDEKKRRIFDAAVDEFSVRRFSEASINQIVKGAVIPRGSFYQYFSGKEDIFMYMLTEIGKEMNEATAKSEPLKEDAGVFDEFLYKAKTSLDFYNDHPAYKKISMLTEKDDSPFIASFRKISSEDQKRVTEMFERDKERGLIKPETDISLVIDIVYTMTLKEFYRDGQDSELFFERVSGMINIIEEGISNKK